MAVTITNKSASPFFFNKKYKDAVARLDQSLFESHAPEAVNAEQQIALAPAQAIFDDLLSAVNAKELKKKVSKQIYTLEQLFAILAPRINIDNQNHQRLLFLIFENYYHAFQDDMNYMLDTAAALALHGTKFINQAQILILQQSYERKYVGNPQTPEEKQSNLQYDFIRKLQDLFTNHPLEFLRSCPETAASLRSDTLYTLAVKNVSAARHILSTPRLKEIIDTDGIDRDDLTYYKIYDANQNSLWLADQVLVVRKTQQAVDNEVPVQARDNREAILWPEAPKIRELRQNIAVFTRGRDEVLARLHYLRSQRLLSVELRKNLQALNSENTDPSEIGNRITELTSGLTELRDKTGIGEEAEAQYPFQDKIVELGAQLLRLNQERDNFLHQLHQINFYRLLYLHDDKIALETRQKSLDFFLHHNEEIMPREECWKNVLDLINFEGKYASLIEERHIIDMFYLINVDNNFNDNFLKIFEYLLKYKKTSFLNSQLLRSVVFAKPNNNPQNPKEIAIENIRKAVFDNHVLIKLEANKDKKGAILSNHPDICKRLYGEVNSDHLSELLLAKWGQNDVAHGHETGSYIIPEMATFLTKQESLLSGSRLLQHAPALIERFKDDEKAFKQFWFHHHGRNENSMLMKLKEEMKDQLIEMNRKQNFDIHSQENRTLLDVLRNNKLRNCLALERKSIQDLITITRGDNEVCKIIAKDFRLIDLLKEQIIQEEFPRNNVYHNVYLIASSYIQKQTRTTKGLTLNSRRKNFVKDYINRSRNIAFQSIFALIADNGELWQHVDKHIHHKWFGLRKRSQMEIDQIKVRLRAQSPFFRAKIDGISITEIAINHQGYFQGFLYERDEPVLKHEVLSAATPAQLLQLANLYDNFKEDIKKIFAHNYLNQPAEIINLANQATAINVQKAFIHEIITSNVHFANIILEAAFENNNTVLPGQENDGVRGELFTTIYNTESLRSGLSAKAWYALLQQGHLQKANYEIIPQEILPAIFRLSETNQDFVEQHAGLFQRLLEYPAFLNSLTLVDLNKLFTNEGKFFANSEADNENFNVLILSLENVFSARAESISVLLQQENQALAHKIFTQNPILVQIYLRDKEDNSHLLEDLEKFMHLGVLTSVETVEKNSLINFYQKVKPENIILQLFHGKTIDAQIIKANLPLFQCLFMDNDVNVIQSLARLDATEIIQKFFIDNKLDKDFASIFEKNPAMFLTLLRSDQFNKLVEDNVEVFAELIDRYQIILKEEDVRQIIRLGKPEFIKKIREKTINIDLIRSILTEKNEDGNLLKALFVALKNEDFNFLAPEIVGDDGKNEPLVLNRLARFNTAWLFKQAKAQPEFVVKLTQCFPIQKLLEDQDPKIIQGLITHASEIGLDTFLNNKDTARHFFNTNMYLAQFIASQRDLFHSMEMTELEFYDFCCYPKNIQKLPILAKEKEKLVTSIKEYLMFVANNPPNDMVARALKVKGKQPIDKVDDVEAYESVKRAYEPDAGNPAYAIPCLLQMAEYTQAKKDLNFKDSSGQFNGLAAIYLNAWELATADKSYDRMLQIYFKIIKEAPKLIALKAIDLEVFKDAAILEPLVNFAREGHIDEIVTEIIKGEKDYLQRFLANLGFGYAFYFPAIYQKLDNETLLTNGVAAGFGDNTIEVARHIISKDNFNAGILKEKEGFKHYLLDQIATAEKSNSPDKVEPTIEPTEIVTTSQPKSHRIFGEPKGKSTFFQKGLIETKIDFAALQTAVKQSPQLEYLDTEIIKEICNHSSINQEEMVSALLEVINSEDEKNFMVQFCIFVNNLDDNLNIAPVREELKKAWQQSQADGNSPGCNQQ